jgi:DNA invertase Pin-like site-specific DNA recombinase
VTSLTATRRIDMQKNGKALRFAALVRVSTETQERQGDSLRTQRSSIERDVLKLAGRVVDWYGGQEHGTAGWERKELDRLLSDASKGKFDAVIVAYADRWSRDNSRSKAGLETFRQHGVRFFVGATEHDLCDPSHRFILGMHAEVGEFLARQSAKKSIEVRIEKARRGYPTCGKLPFARTFDPKTGSWGIDPIKVEQIREIAERLLKGESLNKLSADYGMNHSNLSKTLHHHCGASWSYRLQDENLNIDETITLQVPRLLDDRTIAAVKQVLSANQTYIRSGGRRVNDYLLSDFIFCGQCGHALTGQTIHSNRGKADRTASAGDAYYRHGRKHGAKQCPIRPRPWIPARQIEQAALKDLFQLVGNPAAIERAVGAAMPDVTKARREAARLQAELDKAHKQRGRVVDAIADGVLDNSEAKVKLHEIGQREDYLATQLSKVRTSLEQIPTKEGLQCYVERVRDAMGTAIFVYDSDGNTYAGGNDMQSFLHLMEPEQASDRRRLLETVLRTPTPDGKPSGVYVHMTRGSQRPYRYEIHGAIRWQVSGMPDARQ